jgi:hypothetical protein
MSLSFLFHLLIRINSYRVAFGQDCKLLREEKKTAKEPSLQDVKARMEASGAHTGLMLKLHNIILVLPVGTGSVDDFCNNRRNTNLSCLMRIAVEGPELAAVSFKEVFRSKK